MADDAAKPVDKYCANCVFCKRSLSYSTELTQLKFSRCKHETAFKSDAVRIDYLVVGKLALEEEHLNYCSTMRKESIGPGDVTCGPDARFYQEVERPPTTLQLEERSLKGRCKAFFRYIFHKPTYP